MGNFMRKSYLLLTVSFLFIFSTNANFDRYTIDRLKGIPSINILETYFNGISHEKFDFSKKKIENLLELRLLQCGINLIENGNDADAFLYVEVSSIEGKKDTVVSLRIALAESAHIDRTNSYTLGIVWERDNLLLYTDKIELGKKIIATINEWMDVFSNSYLKANPRKFINVSPQIETTEKAHPKQSLLGIFKNE